MPDTPDKTVGRTPWDFATAVTMRLGPATVVVAGFLGLAIYLYTEINTARLETDQQLQASLAAAQAQLVANTQKMGEMSEQLIKNINSMLELGDKVDKEIQEGRARYDEQLQEIRQQMEASAGALEESKQQVATARAEIDQLTADLKRKQDEFGDLEDRRKQLSVEVSQLLVEKETLTESRRDYAQQVGKLKEKTITFADVTASANEVQNAVADMRARLTGFSDEPRAPDIDEKIGELIGLRESILEKAVEGDGAGFNTWFYLQNVASGAKVIFGYGEQLSSGPRDILTLGVEDGRIYAANLWQASLLFKMPRAENWYQRWVSNFTISSNDVVLASFLDIDFITWDQESLELKYYPDSKLKKKILFGEPSRFDVVTRDVARTEFPEPYRKWSQGNDAYGRPRLILAMLERAETFDGAKVPGLKSFEYPFGLEETTLQVLNASVADDSRTLKNLVGPYVGRDDLGGIAAMALREALRVDRVAKRQSLDQKAAPAEQYEILFSFDAIDPAENRRDAKLTFERSGDRWVLSGFDAIF